MAADSHVLEDLREQYERVYGRPLAAACPPGCSCRGDNTVEDPEDRRQVEDLVREPAPVEQ
jgi:hypothetical protein